MFQPCVCMRQIKRNYISKEWWEFTASPLSIYYPEIYLEVYL